MIGLILMILGPLIGVGIGMIGPAGSAAPSILRVFPAVLKLARVARSLRPKLSAKQRAEVDQALAELEGKSDERPDDEAREDGE